MRKRVYRLASGYCISAPFLSPNSVYNLQINKQSTAYWLPARLTSVGKQRYKKYRTVLLCGLSILIWLSAGIFCVVW